MLCLNQLSGNFDCMTKISYTFSLLPEISLILNIFRLIRRTLYENSTRVPPIIITNSNRSIYKHIITYIKIKLTCSQIFHYFLGTPLP